MMLGRAALLIVVVFIGVDGSPVTQAPTPGPWPNVSTPQPTPNVWSEPCVNDFSPLRADAQSRGRAFQDAIKRKASSQELCTLIEAFYDAEAKVGTFLESHTSACHIPDSTMTTLRSNHNKTLEKKRQICICSADFLQLRTEYEKQQQALQEAIKHRDPQEICKLYGSLTEAGNKLVAFAEGNAALCGTTDQMLSAAKSAYNRGLELKQQACAAAVNDRAGK